MIQFWNYIQKYSYFIALSLTQGGLFYVANCIVGVSSAFFYQKLHMKTTTLNLIFGGLIPVFLIFFQFVVGFISDSLNGKFKRRAMIIVGTIILVVSMPILGFCDQIGYSLGDEYFEESSGNESESSNQIIGIIFGFITVFFSYIAYSFIQSPCRALIVDLVSSEDQDTVNFIASMLSGIAAVIFYILASTLTTFSYYYPTIYISTAAVMLISCLVTCIVGNESKKLKTLENDLLLETEPQKKSAISLFKGVFKTMSLKLILLYCMECIGMMAFGGIGMNLCNFYAQNFYHSTSDDDSYNDGISMGMVGMMVMSISQTIYSFISPLIFKNRTNLCWIISFIISSIAFVGMIICDVISKNYPIPPWWLLTISYICMACFGMIGCCVYSIPFSLIKLLSEEEYIGIHMSLLVSIIQLSMCLTGLIFFILLLIFDSLVVVFYACGVVSFITVISSIFILRIINPPE